MQIDAPSSTAAKAAAIQGSLRRITDAMQPALRPGAPPVQMSSGASPAMTNCSLETTAFPEFGQFSDLEVPGKWNRQRKQMGSPTNSCFLQFKLDGESQTLLCYYVRGFAVGPAATNAFRSIIAKRPHALDVDERQSITEVLRDKSPTKDFRLTSLRTIEISGRKALIAEGLFMISNLHAAAVFVESSDQDAARCTVEELSYIAPKNAYYMHYADVIRSFQKLTWSAVQRAALFK